MRALSTGTLATASPPPPLALRSALRERYAGSFVERLRDENAARARERSLDWLEREIEACYDARYVEDAKSLRGLLGENGEVSNVGLNSAVRSTDGEERGEEVERRETRTPSASEEASREQEKTPTTRGADVEDDDDEAQSFSDFVFEYWGRTFGVRNLVEKHLWEVICNAEAARKAKRSDCAELFCAFIQRSYDEEALLFFLYCRKWLKHECASMARRGERVFAKETVSAHSKVAGQVDSGLHVCDVALDERQTLCIVRSIFSGGSDAPKKDTTFLHATIKAMVEDAFSSNAEASWASQRNGVGSDHNGKSGVLMDGYRLLKMLLSVFFDTKPPPGVILKSSKPVKSHKTERHAKNLSTAMEALAVDENTQPAPAKTAPPAPRPRQPIKKEEDKPKATPSQPQEKVVVTKPVVTAPEQKKAPIVNESTPPVQAPASAVAPLSNKTSNDVSLVSAEIDRYGGAASTALSEAVGKYAAALFPKQVAPEVISQAETKINAVAQEMLKRVIGNSSDPSVSQEILEEAPEACKAFARARDSIAAGVGTPGSESPASANGSSTRDVARAILATPHVRAAIEPMLKSAVQSLKTAPPTQEMASSPV